MSQVGSTPLGVQIHDYSPGITDSGLFWTVAVPPETVAYDSDLQTSSLRVTDLDLVDATNLANALAGGPDVPAKVSFEVVWRATGDFQSLRDEANGFMGRFRDAEATVSWTGSTERSSYVSDPADTSTPVFAVVGHERNGSFFT